MSLLPPKPGCRVALVLTVGLSIGATLGAFVGCVAAYCYVEPPWDPLPPDSTIAPLRHSLAGWSGLIGGAVGVPIGAVLGFVVSAVVAFVIVRRDRRAVNGARGSA